MMKIRAQSLFHRVASRSLNVGKFRLYPWWYYVIIGGSISLAAIWGLRNSLVPLFVIVALPLFIILLREPRWGLVALPWVALLVPFQINTGTEVVLNSVVFFVPLLAGFWLLRTSLNRDIRVSNSRLYGPLALLLGTVLFSWLLGNLLWEPNVPKPGNLTLIQAGQVSIYLVSFFAFWLAANLPGEIAWLRRMSYSLVAVSGIVLCLLLLPAWFPLRRILSGGMPNLVWVWVSGLALALIFHDDTLKQGQRRVLLLGLLLMMLYLWLFQREWYGAWMPALVTMIVTVGLYLPRSKTLLLIVAAILLVMMFLPVISQTIQWESEWEVSGSSRLTMWRSILELVFQRPLFGLGIVAYRYYHYVKPLRYGNALWLHPNISAHNQYVDVFAQIGIVGLVAYLCFLVELMVISWRIYTSSQGFARAYALAVLAGTLGTIAADMIAATSLPFVYNNSFPGLRGSVLAWMMWGGLVIIEKSKAT